MDWRDKCLMRNTIAGNLRELRIRNFIYFLCIIFNCMFLQIFDNRICQQIYVSNSFFNFIYKKNSAIICTDDDTL